MKISVMTKKQTIVAACSAFTSIVYAANWQLADESAGSAWIKRLFVDVESIVSDKEDITYFVKSENYDKDGSRASYFDGQSRRSVANCARKEKFEVTDYSEWATRPFKATHAGTVSYNEVQFACSYFENRRGGLKQNPEPPTAGNSVPLPSEKTAQPNRSFGSGFAVASGTIVTNNHVIEKCSSFRVRQGSKVTPATLLAVSAKEDLAILQADVSVEIVPGIRSNAALGEDVMVAGHPLAGLLGSDLIVASGQVNAMAGLRNDPTNIQISAPVQPGNSGGPLIDRYGNIVGVVVAKLNVASAEKVTGDFAQNVNFAIKPEILRLFLDANSVAYTTNTSTSKLEGTELAKRARNFAFQIICK